MSEEILTILGVGVELGGLIYTKTWRAWKVGLQHQRAGVAGRHADWRAAGPTW